MPSDIQELQRAFDMNVKAIDEAYDRTAKRCHLSPSSFDILYTLFAYGDGCTQKELCERCYDGKQTVNQYVASVAKENNAKIAVKSFVRFETGEGLEKKEENFAEEVAKQMNQ